MRFERDDQAGITIRVNTIAHAVFILVSVGLCVKVMLDTPPTVSYTHLTLPTKA